MLLCALLVSIPAWAYTPETEKDYSCASDYFAVSHIDTNGQIYVGVRVNRITYSTDFENWSVIDGLPDVNTVIYLDGAFRAVGNGVTLVSSDGINWEQYTNNLPAPPDDLNTARIKDRAVIFVNDCNGSAGTYSTTDCIDFKRIDGFPDGIKLYNVNGLLMGESHEYMRGIYYSSDGINFEKAIIPGYDESYGPFNVGFDGENYVVNDFWRKIDDEAFAYRYTSSDLKNWTESVVPRAELLSNNESCVRIGDELNIFDQNGGNYVLKNGERSDGKYNMRNGSYPNMGYVFYNFSDYGVLAWSSDKIIYHITDGGEFKSFDFGSIDSGFSDEYRTEGGCASNGVDVLRTEFIERGSWEYYEENREIMGTITRPDGTSYQVVYEDATGDTVDVYGGDGYFVLRTRYDKFYYSRDGITRNDVIDFLSVVTQFKMDNGEFKYLGENNVIYMGRIPNMNDNYPTSPMVALNGRYLSFVTPPIIENDRILIPIRFLFEQTGANVEWDDASKTVTIAGDKTVVLTVGDKTARVDGVIQTMDVPPMIVNDKTLIPLRFVAENLGFNVEWDNASKTADINL